MDSQYVYIAMVGAYDNYKILGVYTEKDVALKKAKRYIKEHRGDFQLCYAIKTQLNQRCKGTIVI